MYESLKMPDYIKIVAVDIAICGTVSYLFYNSLWGLVLTPIGYVVALRIYRNNQIEKQKSKLTAEFIDGLRCVSNALMAGYSLENAWIEAQKELALMHGEDSIMCIEFGEMNRCQKMSIPLEKSLENFAKQSEVEDILTFSEIFSFAKRSGGSFVDIIESTTYKINAKYETNNEISVTIASKKLEQKVMNVVPVFIVAYMRVTSPDYMECLYGNPLGISFMTCCLVVYAMALVLAEKIINIKV